MLKNCNGAISRSFFAKILIRISYRLSYYVMTFFKNFKIQFQISTFEVLRNKNNYCREMLNFELTTGNKKK